MQIKKIRIKKAHAASFLGSTRTGANGRMGTALWNIEDAETGEVLARLFKECGRNWIACPVKGDSFDWGAPLSRRWAENRQHALKIAAEVLGAEIVR